MHKYQSTSTTYAIQWDGKQQTLLAIMSAYPRRIITVMPDEALVIYDPPQDTKSWEYRAIADVCPLTWFISGDPDLKNLQILRPENFDHYKLVEE